MLPTRIPYATRGQPVCSPWASHGQSMCSQRARHRQHQTPQWQPMGTPRTPHGPPMGNSRAAYGQAMCIPRTPHGLLMGTPLPPHSVGYTRTTYARCKRNRSTENVRGEDCDSSRERMAPGLIRVDDAQFQSCFLPSVFCTTRDDTILRIST